MINQDNFTLQPIHVLKVCSVIKEKNHYVTALVEEIKPASLFNVELRLAKGIS